MVDYVDLFNIFFDFFLQCFQLFAFPLIIVNSTTILTLYEVVFAGGIILFVIRSVLALPSAISSNVEREK